MGNEIVSLNAFVSGIKAGRKYCGTSIIEESDQYYIAIAYNSIVTLHSHLVYSESYKIFKDLAVEIVWLDEPHVELIYSSEVIVYKDNEISFLDNNEIINVIFNETKLNDVKVLPLIYPNPDLNNEDLIVTNYPEIDIGFNGYYLGKSLHELEELLLNNGSSHALLNDEIDVEIWKANIQRVIDYKRIERDFHTQRHRNIAILSRKYSNWINMIRC